VRDHKRNASTPRLGSHRDLFTAGAGSFKRVLGCPLIDPPERTNHRMAIAAPGYM
jgi:hypothetical protein